MNYQNPIYTVKTECQDCYKCVRVCPVKAIKIEKESACVIPELCLLCGLCVKVCPVGAKKIRSDLGRVRQLLTFREKVVVSLAPSYQSEFPGVEPLALIKALKKLGFFGVSETALGAQEVSAHVAVLIKEQLQKKLHLSTACPTAVSYICKKFPQYAEQLTPIVSPVLAHAKMLKQVYGQQTGVVFIGPCISKKEEADNFKELLDAALTFNDLRLWLQEEKISLVDHALSEVDPEEFLLATAEEGSIYPLEGGMIAGIKANCSVTDTQYMSFSGLSNIKKALEQLDKLKIEEPLFLELLACDGGCINGPQTEEDGATIVKRQEVLGRCAYTQQNIPRQKQLDLLTEFKPQVIDEARYSEAELTRVLNKIGKFKPEDELNCGGCGYDSCRDFAVAFLNGNAEEGMCISYMRKLAQNKANALLRTMPSGVVIVDENLQIIEVNKIFAKISGSDLLDIYQAKPGLKGAYLNKVIPFYKLFEDVLKTGVDIVDKDIKFHKTILKVSVFAIEPRRIVGGIVRDVTEPAVRKDQVVKKAKEVINKNLKTVQEIAYLLGENASETEILLDSIIEAFSLDEEQK